jgi:hypothetical protein
LNDQFISSSLEYTKPVVNPPYLENITAPPQTFSTMRISSLTDPTVELDHSTPAGRQDIFATGTYNNGAAISAEIFDLANATAQPLRDIVDISFPATAPDHHREICHQQWRGREVARSECKQWQSLQSAYQHQEVHSSGGPDGTDRGVG